MAWGICFWHEYRITIAPEEMGMKLCLLLAREFQLPNNFSPDYDGEVSILEYSTIRSRGLRVVLQSQTRTTHQTPNAIIGDRLSLTVNNPDFSHSLLFIRFISFDLLLQIPPESTTGRIHFILPLPHAHIATKEPLSGHNRHRRLETI